jgi:hypothetical protein
MRKDYPSIEREKTIRARQERPAWGKHYTPGQLGTREEAPDYSRPSSVYSPWLQRLVHCMGEPELIAFIFGSWLGCFVDLHEGRMMSPEPSAGFLIGCPFSQQSYVGSHCGTLQAAYRLGLMEYHPLIRRGNSMIGFPLLADLLWFGKDDEGVFLINWCIKFRPEDFTTAFKTRGPTAKRKSDEEHRARLQIEAEIFKDAKSRTISIALLDIAGHLQNNLRMIYPYTGRERTLPEKLRQDFIETIKYRIPKQVPLHETMTKFINKYGGAFHDYLIALYQALWNEEVTCDLYRPVQPDLPLRPADKNIKKMYSQWCTRGLI